MKHIAVIIPAYKVKNRVLNVIAAIGDEVSTIILVDDACPQKTADYVKENCLDPRLVIIKNSVNLGVGGAVKAGYYKGLTIGTDIMVKIDGDGQMDPRLISDLCAPILNEQADYIKGNRFFNPRSLAQMPKIRLLGNAIISFLCKLASGYWSIMDPSNGFTAIDTRILRELPLDKISNRYFFESDMLFRLAIVKAKVSDFPMHSRYAGEHSSLSITKTAATFPFKFLKRFIKRLGYSYYLRGFNVASLFLIVGICLFGFGIVSGVMSWSNSIATNIPATSGQVMLAALPIFVGLQLLLSFINYDVSNEPREPISKYLL